MDQFVVAVEIRTLEVVEQLSSTSCKRKETTTSVEVLAVSAKVLGQVADTSREESYLYVARSGVGIVRLVFADNLIFIDCFVIGHVCFLIRGNFGFSVSRTVSQAFC